jgi:hypothetical protein
MGWHVPAVGRRVAVVSAIALLVTVMIFAGVAYAAPDEPVMSVPDLAAKIAAAPGNVVQGHLKTVLHGSRIDVIDVDIYAVTAQGGGPDDTFILFEATGPEIDRAGGIIAGMSGSPIFVHDDVDDRDELVGAVSYGDIFTRGGMGLATPVDRMSQLETEYAVLNSVDTRVAAKVKSGVVLELSPDVAGRLGVARSVIAKPLSTLMVGGVSASAPRFTAFKTRMAAKGIDVISAAAPLSSGDPTFEVPFESGASIAVLQSRGDLWAGGVGTVTYEHDGTVVAFGHPMDWTGPSGLEMANAWVDGVWPSALEPYKLAAPGKLRGTITQDRASGVLGTTAALPDEAAVTAHAIDTDTGRSAAATSFMPAFAMGEDYGLFLPSMAAYLPGQRVLDSFAGAGSAMTTTTIVVGDGASSYTLTRRNIFDDPSDIASALVRDVDTAMATLQRVGSAGVQKPQVSRIDVESTLTRTRRAAEVVDVTAPGGLARGVNHVNVVVRVNGVAAPQTIVTTVTIPAGTSLMGTLSVRGAASEAYDEGDPVVSAATEPTSVQGAVAQLAATPRNSDLIVTYRPYGYDPYGRFVPSVGPDVETTVSTGWYLEGSVAKTTSEIAYAWFYPTVVSYRGSVRVEGYVFGVGSGTVKLVSRDLSTNTSQVLGTYALGANSDYAVFAFLARNLTRNCVLTIVYSGDANTLGCSVAKRIYVRAGIGLAASAKRVAHGTRMALTASVAPSHTTGAVTFEYLRRGTWVVIGTRALGVDSKTAVAWSVPTGTWQVRARYLGNGPNYASTSNAVSVTGF